MNRLIKNIAIYVLVAFPLYLSSQTVALVLSGGAAKAYAHVGVLKALEENNIPIDFIVGNSMGSLIGALYSSGYSPDEIKLILSNPEFLSISKKSNLNSVCFYQRNEPDASFVNFPFNIDKGFSVKLPLSVYNLQEIDYALMEYFSGASAVSGNNFDSLMIPFRCVAADIDSSRLIAFNHGNLAKSVRASITFPFFVRPVNIDGVVFFDGGMYDNFPVSTAVREFDPDLILGSKAVNNFSSPNPDDAISLMQSMLMAKADFEIDSTLGLVIETMTGEESIFHFSKINDYIDSGYVAAYRMMPEIIERTRQNNSVIPLSKKREKFKARFPKRKIGCVSITGVNEKQKSYFLKLIGDPVRYNNTNKFGDFYDCLLSNENVMNIYPEMIFDSITSNYDLNLVIKKSEPFNLKVGGYISSTGINEGFIEVGYKYLGKSAKSMSIGSYFGTFYNSFSTMGKVEFPGSLPFYIKMNFLVSRKNYFSNARYYFEDEFPAYIIADENYLEFSMGVPVGFSGLAAMGITNINAHFQYYQDNYFTRTDTADVSNFYFLSPYVEFEFNSLNRKEFATAGQYFYTGFSYFTGYEKYTKGSGKTPETELTDNLNYYTLTIRYFKYFELSNKLSTGLSAEVGLSSKPLLSSYISSLLLAAPYEPIPIMKTLFLENYRANNFGGIGASFAYNFYKKFDFMVNGYYYVPYNKLLKDSDNNTAYLSTSLSYQYFLGSAQLIYHPPFGAISASVNYIERPGSKVSFLLNLGFLIFNKSRLNR